MGNNSKRKNYFSDNIQKFGENFLQQFDAKKLRNDARRVINDIAFGNIDFDEYGIYFSDPQFISAIIDVIYTKLTIHGTSYTALEHMSREITNSDIENIKRYHRRLMEVYNLFYDYFTAIRESGYSRDSIAALKALSTRARDYAQDLIDPVFSTPGGMSPSAAYSQPAVNNIYNAPQYIQEVTAYPIEQVQQEAHPFNSSWFYSDEAKNTRFKR